MSLCPTLLPRTQEQATKTEISKQLWMATSTASSMHILNTLQNKNIKAPDYFGSFLYVSSIHSGKAQFSNTSLSAKQRKYINMHEKSINLSRTFSFLIISFISLSILHRPSIYYIQAEYKMFINWDL